MQPPLLPEAVLRRVLRLANFDGWGVLLLSGSFALASALSSDRVGAIVGLLVAGAGAIELHGAGLLEARRPSGTKWLVGSQLYLIVVVIAFCLWQYDHANLDWLRAGFTDDVNAQIAELGYTPDQFLRIFNHVVCGGVAIGTLLYQGSMAIYYARRSALVHRAVEIEPETD